ncbi:SprT family zinc-dependent metalloprotease [uncultured Thiothrix sp.]|uniref:M48 family metallopeptidase n=1 Tax=uncultured Thiothrix sp. TaxID=223185 RepID=UPI00262E10A8|nr:SprT family zinc-dependent metalloprotease [uncultured Thiothrix sp.]HMT94466.1 SprT family zinc-dependent metalloprotease [Thiolinea sp.]
MNARRIRDIDYYLLPGSPRKTTDIVIERDGTVTVRPPEHYTPEQVDTVVDSKRLWIYRNLAEWRYLNASAVVRSWVNGESFLYLGRTYRLALVADQAQDLLLKDGRFCLHRPIIETGGVEAAKQAFEHYYTQKGQQRFQERVGYYVPKVGVSASLIKVKDMGFRWASCGGNGQLNFHWKCMMAPPKVIDYIVVHELCHLHHQHHDDAFWNEVDKILPDYCERKEWLKKYGASLNL